MASLPVAQQIEDKEITNFHVIIYTIHSKLSSPPTTSQVLKVLRGTERSDPSVSYAIYGGATNGKFAIYSDRGSGKIAVYQNQNSLIASVYSFLGRSVRRDLRDTVTTYSAINEKGSYGGFEAKGWTNVYQDSKPRSPENAVKDIASRLPKDCNENVMEKEHLTAGTTNTAATTIYMQKHKKFFPLLMLVGICMVIALFVVGFTAIRKKKFGTNARDLLDLEILP